MSTEDAPEFEQGVSTLAAPLLVWTAHFVVVYAVAAIVCAKETPLLVLRLAVAAATALALGVIASMGVKGHRRSRSAPSPLVGERAGVRGSSSEAEQSRLTTTKGEADAAARRRRFLGFVALLIAALSSVAVLYSALVFVLVRDCR